MDTFHTTADNSWGLEPLIDVGELATYLGVPVSTIYHWRGLDPPAYRLGKHLKFAVFDVRGWILYTDETPFVPVHSRLTPSETIAICPVCHGKRMKPESLIESLVAGPHRPPRRICDPQKCVPHQRSVLLRSRPPRGCGSAFVHWSIWGWATFH